MRIKQDEKCKKSLFDFSNCDFIFVNAGIKIIDTNTGNVVGRGYRSNRPYNEIIKIKTEIFSALSKEKRIKLYKESITKKLVEITNLILDKIT